MKEKIANILQKRVEMITLEDVQMIVTMVDGVVQVIAMFLVILNPINDLQIMMIHMKNKVQDLELLTFMRDWFHLLHHAPCQGAAPHLPDIPSPPRGIIQHHKVDRVVDLFHLSR
jgi:hypothetical protein